MAAHKNLRLTRKQVRGTGPNSFAVQGVSPA
jgi:hypothetical protein